MYQLGPSVASLQRSRTANWGSNCRSATRRSRCDRRSSRYARPQGDHPARTTETRKDGDAGRAPPRGAWLFTAGGRRPVFDLKEKRCQPLRAGQSSSCARDRSRRAETTSSGHESPVRNRRMRQFRIMGPQLLLLQQVRMLPGPWRRPRQHSASRIPQF